MHSYAKRMMLFSVNEFLIGVVVTAGASYSSSPPPPLTAAEFDRRGIMYEA